MTSKAKCESVESLKKREKTLFDSYNNRKSYTEKIKHLEEMIEIMKQIDETGK